MVVEGTLVTTVVITEDGAAVMLVALLKVDRYPQSTCKAQTLQVQMMATPR